MNKRNTAKEKIKKNREFPYKKLNRRNSEINCKEVLENE